jgi:tRNA nucleotidyltransferase (CCA-adding enzyme)
MSRLVPPAAIVDISRTLERAGHEAWCVGGAVRDALLGIATLDWDVATSARPEEVQRLFKRTVPVGIQFGTVGVLDRDGVLHEVTTFRHDVETDGRHAVVRFGASLEEDLARRDFTVNAIAVHAERLEVRDPFGGRADLEAQVIRCVGEPRERMREDRLRALRAVRFAGRFGFRIDPATWDAIRESAPHLGRLSMERVKQELEKVLAQVARPGATLERYREAGILDALMPVLAAAPVARFAALDHLRPTARAARAVERVALRLAACLAEPGAPPPRDLERTLKALKFSNAEARLAVAMARALGALAWPLGDWDDVTLRRAVAAVGRLDVPAVARLCWARRTAELEAQGADAIARTAARRAGVALYRRARRMAWHDPLAIGDLAVDGDDLRTAGITEGRAIGETLQRLLDAVLEDPARNTRESLLALARAS